MVPAVIWKRLPIETRLAAAEAFWRDDRGEGALDVQKMEATVAIARRLNFRAKSVQALPTDRRAKHLAHLPDVSDALAARALVAYHLAAQRPLMAAFLDAVGIAHENGVITADEVAPPGAAQLATGVEAIRASFPAADVALYLDTLAAIDGETWAGLPSNDERHAS